LEKYRALVAQAADATEQTSQTAEIQRLAASLSENIRIIADPLFQDTYFLIAYKGKKGKWYATHFASERFKTDKFIPGIDNDVFDAPFTFNIPVVKTILEDLYYKSSDGGLIKASAFTLPKISLEMGRKYFLTGSRDISIMNQWLFSNEQLMNPGQQPLKPKFFRGDICTAGLGYYTPLKKIDGMLLVEFHIWSHDDKGCPTGTLIEVSESDFAEEVNLTKGEGNIFIHTIPSESEEIYKELASIIVKYTKEASVLRAARQAAAELARRHQEMQKFIDAQMANGATQP
jgi:hypothetical protein